MFSNVLKNNFSFSICLLIIVSHPIHCPVNKVGTFYHVIITKNVTKQILLRISKLVFPPTDMTSASLIAYRNKLLELDFNLSYQTEKWFHTKNSVIHRFPNDSKSPCFSQSSYLSVVAESLSVHRLSFACIECFRFPLFIVRNTFEIFDSALTTDTA